MNTVYERSFTIPPSYCDESARMSIAGAFTLFQDIAGFHAEAAGYGVEAMRNRGVFWLTVRTRVRFYEKPKLMQETQIATWMNEYRPRDVRVDRFYRLRSGDTVLAEGRTEWAVMRLSNGSIATVADSGAEEPQNQGAQPVCTGPFRRMRTVFAPEDLALRHTVAASEIDFGRHMNNLAYVRLLLDSFTADELAALQPRELELAFRAPCLYGEELQVCRRPAEGGWAFEIRRPDGKPAAQAELELEP